MSVATLDYLRCEFPKDSKEILHKFGYYVHQSEVTEERIAVVIEVLKVQGKLNTPLNRKGVTPLIASILAGKNELVKKLIEAGCLIEKSDNCGWTPKHHAVAFGDASLQELFPPQARTNKWGGTPSTLNELLSKPTYAESDELFDYMEDGVLKKGSAEKFKQITGAHFTDRLVASKEGLFYEWQQEVNSTGIGTGAMYVKERPKVHLEKRADGVGWELVATNPIEKESVIGEYFGLLTDTENHIGEYSFRNIDATYYRGLMSFANDGFPNAIARPVYNQKGVRERIVFIALTRITGAIYLDYTSSHSIKKGDYKLLNQKDLEKWYQGRNITQFVTELRNPRKKSYALYLATTPKAMYHLYFKDILAIRDLETLFNTLQVREALDRLCNLTVLHNLMNSDVKKYLLDNLDRLQVNAFSQLVILTATALQKGCWRDLCEQNVLLAKGIAFLARMIKNETYSLSPDAFNALPPLIQVSAFLWLINMHEFTPLFLGDSNFAKFAFKTAIGPHWHVDREGGCDPADYVEKASKLRVEGWESLDIIFSEIRQRSDYNSLYMRANNS